MSSEIRPPVGPPRSNKPKPFQRSLPKDATTGATSCTPKDATTGAPKDHRPRRDRPDENPRKKEKTTSRALLVKDIAIFLTHDDPVERLKEFCEQGRYMFHWNWDKFATGVMCELEISYLLDTARTSKGDRRKVLAKESRYISSESGDLVYAQKVVAAILLDRLGLGVPEPVRVGDDAKEGAEDTSDSSEDTNAGAGVNANMGDEIMENLMKSLATKLNQNLEEAGVSNVSSLLGAVCASVTGGNVGGIPPTASTPTSKTARWADIVKDKHL